MSNNLDFELIVISIVAIHGLDGDPLKTWTTKKTNKCWLGDPDMLPKFVKNSRILTYGYNASVAALGGKTSSDRIMHHAHTLVAELVADRQVIRKISEVFKTKANGILPIA
jgi:hypothetical protein